MEISELEESLDGSNKNSRNKGFSIEFKNNTNPLIRHLIKEHGINLKNESNKSNDKPIEEYFPSNNKMKKELSKE